MVFVMHLIQNLVIVRRKKMSEETILQVKNLRVDFHTYAGEIKAIRDVNFDLKKGETLAIVGESGSGKSVTTKTLMGLSAPNADRKSTRLNSSHVSISYA